MLVDSHCHLNCLDLKNHENSLSKAIEAAKLAGISRMLCVCIDLAHFPEVLAIARQYADVDASVGIHPNEDQMATESVEKIVELASDNKVVAIGETGLDYFRSSGDLNWQRQRFTAHIEAAKILKKPLIIHSRQAKQDTIKLMRTENAAAIGGVMHCFTEDYAMAKQAMDLGFYISFSGIITFKNAVDLQETVKKISLDRLLIETDSPYLAPMPHRGQSNEPAYVRFVAEKIAELKGISFAEVAKKTSENYFKLFHKK